MKIGEIYRRFRAWQLNPFDYTNRSKHPERCANCGSVFSANYCPICGQKAGLGPISWRTVRQGLTMIWGMDSRSLFYSLVQLVLRPGYLISDYISGKRQVSFPPVKMVLIVTIGSMVADFLFGESSVDTTAEAEADNAAMGMFIKWAEANQGWAMLVISSFMILPTWFFFRYAPKHRKHTLPEGFFIQVFMSSLLAMLAILSTAIKSTWLLMPIPFYYIITYRQLFGFGWWGTIWRTCICIYSALALMVLAGEVGNHIIGAPHLMPGTAAAIIGFTLFFMLIGFLVDQKRRKAS